MKTIVTLNKIEDIKELAKQNVFGVIFSTALASSRLPAVFSIEQCETIQSEVKKVNMKWIFAINRLILQTEWEVVINQIESIASLKPDFFLVSDVGVSHYLINHYPEIPIIFQSDTTITNAFDTQTILDLGIKIVVLARELTLEENIEIITYFPNQVCMPIFGYPLMSTSKRPLLSNYATLIDKPQLNKLPFVYLQEEKRTDYFLAMEDQHGFHIFHSHALDTTEELPQLIDAGLGYGLIETQFIESELVYDFCNFTSPFNMNMDLKNRYPHHKFGKALLYTPTSSEKGKNG